MGPMSRPVLQEMLCLCEKCVREGTYTVNPGLGLADVLLRYKTRLQVTSPFSRLTSAKGSHAAKKVSDSLKELRDLCAFHLKVSISLGVMTLIVRWLFIDKIKRIMFNF